MCRRRSSRGLFFRIHGTFSSQSRPAVSVLKMVHGKRLATVFIGKNILAGRCCNGVNPKCP